MLPVEEVLFFLKEIQPFPKKACLVLVVSGVVYYPFCQAFSSLTSSSESPRAPAHVKQAPPQGHQWLQSLE